MDIFKLKYGSKTILERIEVSSEPEKYLQMQMR
jgi:hypothetical protein